MIARLALACLIAVAASAATVADGPAEPRRAAANTRQRLVVTTFDEQGVPAGLGDVVADLLIRSIDSPSHELVERRQVRRVLEEQAFAASDLTQPGEAVRYGRLADTRYVLVGTVYRVDGLYMVSARMVDSATGIVHESSRAVVQFRTVDEMADRVNELATLMRLRVPRESAPWPGGSETAQTTPADRSEQPRTREATTTPTVRDYLEQIGAGSQSHVAMSVPTGMRTVEAGTELRFTVRSDATGYVTLMVVDADGRVGILVPNARLPELRIIAQQPISIPEDVPFTLRAQPPFGTTRIKVIVTPDPLPIPDRLKADEVIQYVSRGDRMTSSDAGEPSSSWTSAEVEFLVVPRQSAVPQAHPAPASPASAPRIPATAPAPVGAGESPSTGSGAVGMEHDRDLASCVDEAMKAVTDSSVIPTDVQYACLRWPLRSPFVPAYDLRWSPSDAQSGRTPCVAVIDADFDPDDPLLQKSFSSISVTERERLRAEIRRNGQPSFRHGNRVASLIAGEAPWLPAVIPGARVVPIRITTIDEAPSYRADRGGVRELLDALRASMSTGCRVVNLSLSVPLAGSELASFSSDPVWDELERKEVVVVCAAGNGREDLDATPRYPACLERPNILCVGAVGPDGRIATWGDQGSAYGRRSVDVFAPGSHIAVSDGGGRGGIASGTSYACAFASAAVARLIADEPEIRASDAINRIIAGAVAVPELDGLSKAGLLRWPTSQR